MARTKERLENGWHRRECALPMSINPMLTTLTLRDFRCFENLECALGEDITLFVGDNAQGKTSILEAACVLLRLQSPRAGAMGEMIRFEQSAFAIVGDYARQRMQLTHDGKRRKMVIDGGEVKKGVDYLAGSGLVVWIGNDDLQLIRGGGDPRRRYLDFIASQLHPAYRPALKTYEKALRSRNWLLKKDASPDWRSIDAYSKLLVEHGTTITTARMDLVDALQPWAEDAQRQVSGADAELLSLDYLSGAGDDFGSALEDSRDEEMRKRQTLVGPHRDDVGLRVGGRPAGQFASEGQQRTIAVALKLAQARLLEDLTGKPPLLLVDDVFGELDTRRRNALLGYLPANSQKLITTTHLDWADSTVGGAVKLYRVSSGTVNEA